MRNLLLKISYDGKYYHGWQIQKNAVTVQEVFQDALKNILGVQPDLKGCSRTTFFLLILLCIVVSK